MDGVGGIFTHCGYFPTSVVGADLVNRSFYFSCLPDPPPRSPQIAFIRELRAALLCPFHFGVPSRRGP